MLHSASAARPAPRYAVSSLILLTLLIYLPFVGGGFRTDDFAHLEHLSAFDSMAGLVASPDTFGFFRPLTQSSLWLDRWLFGDAGGGYRLVNLLLHSAVLALVFAVAWRLTDSSMAAWLTTLVFGLTPKAHPIAVLWISARAELLMAVGVLTAVTAWLQWAGSGRRRWIGVLLLAYAGAIFSKETAILLPVVLLAVPAPARTWRARGGVILLLVAVALLAVAARARVGARMPTMDDGPYLASMPVAGLLHNFRNYAERMAPAPVALLVVCGIATGIAVGWRRALATVWPIPVARHDLVLLAVVWTTAFLAPTLPFTARSELYVYLPVFGPSLVAGIAAASLLDSTLRNGLRAGRLPAAGLALWSLTLVFYQAGRAWEMHRDHVFSRRFVAAVARDPDIAATRGPVHIVPADAIATRLLQNAVGGYLSVVLRRAFPDHPIAGTVGPPAQGASAGLTVICSYDGVEVTCRK